MFRNSERTERWRTLLAAWAAIFVPLGGLATATGSTTFKIVAYSCGIATAIGIAVLATIEVRRRSVQAEVEGDLEQRLRLRVAIAPIRDIDPHHVDIDPEIATAREAGSGAAPYVPRDADERVRDAILHAMEHGCGLVVVEGASKAGKSRLLFEAALATVPDAALIAPMDKLAFQALLRSPPPFDGDSAVVWLDDLEPFLSVTSDGLTPAALAIIASWRQPIAVLGTHGGKGARLLPAEAREQLVEPAREILNRATVVPLLSDLSERELAEAAERYAPDAIEGMRRHGIGEYMVAGPELARKLTTGRHPGGDRCPEGEAVTWAAIDWARAGRTTGPSVDEIRALATHYAKVPLEAESFARGLSWAQRPLYASIALVMADPPRPYDFIVSFVDRELKRPIHPAAWDALVDAAEGHELLGLGLMAVQRKNEDRAMRIWERGADENDAEIAAACALNCSALRLRQDDHVDSERWVRRALERADGALRGKALSRLGFLLWLRKEHGEAKRALQGALEFPLDAVIRSTTLGNLADILLKEGDLDAAEAAYLEAASSPEPMQRAGMLDAYGDLRRERGDLVGAEQAYRDAIASGDPVWTATALVDLGAVQMRKGEVTKAEETWRKAIACEHDYWSNNARVRLAWSLQEHGELAEAEQMLQEAAKCGRDSIEARAHLGLAVLARGQGDDNATLRELRAAAGYSDEDAAVIARELLRRRSD